jgi:CheY-like chemotaxis protein
VRPTNRARVLVVDDNPINLQVASRNLEKLGCEVHAATDGAEAVALLQELEVDVVLMDIQMPVMDGFEATRVIREREQRTGGRVPIVAMTAHAMAGYRELCLQAGMDEYITKPLRLTEVDRVLGRWFGEAKTDQGTPHEAGPTPVEPAVRTRPADPPVSAGVLGELDAPVLDRVQLDEASGGDPELQQQLLDMLLDTGASNLDQAAEALSKWDEHVARRAIHSLKGAAATVGAARLAQACRHVERLRHDQLPLGLEQTRMQLGALERQRASI